jgi:hypothetical protein
MLSKRKTKKIKICYAIVINAYNYRYSHTHTQQITQNILNSASLTINMDPSTITLVNKTQTHIK